MLLHRRLLEIFSECLDVSGDVQWLDLIQCAEFVMLAPGEEPAGCVEIRRPRVLVADGHGEEFEEAFRRSVAGVGDDRRHHDRRRDGAGGFSRTVGQDDGQLAVGIWFGLGHGISVT
jgi:hypothetical protein